MADLINKQIAFMTPEDIRTAHATHVVVQNTPGCFVLSFFECLPPVIIGTTEAEKQAAWAKIRDIPATCVARLVVAEVDFAGFLQVMQQQQAAAKQQALQGYKAFA